MSNVIDMGESLAGRLREQLRERDLRIATLEQELKAARAETVSLSGINDMLRLQINEMLSILNQHQQNIDMMRVNLNNIKTALPTIKK